MSMLAGKIPKDTFGQLLHIEGGLSSTLRVVEDGTGQPSPLSLSTAVCSVPSLSVPYSVSAPASMENAVVLYAQDGTLWQVCDETGPVALSSSGGGTPKLVSVTGVSPYTLYDISGNDHETVFVLDYSAAYIFLSLPTVQGNNGVRLVFQVHASGVGCELTAWGTETIDGQTTINETTLQAGVVLDLVANAAAGR